MKKTVLLICIFPFLFQSCSLVEELAVTREGHRAFVNKSERDIIISSYKDKHSYNSDGILVVSTVFDKKISLKNQDGFSFSRQLSYHSEPFDISELIGDSIVIDYGDKIKKYGGGGMRRWERKYRDLIKNSCRSPYLLDSGSELNFTYTLTPEDYEDADPK